MERKNASERNDEIGIMAVMKLVWNLELFDNYVQDVIHDSCTEYWISM